MNFDLPGSRMSLLRRFLLACHLASCRAGLVIFLLLTACGRNEEKQPARIQDENIIQDKVGKIQNAAYQKFEMGMPIYQYYQKIPEMSGVTNDPENLIFTLQIELGYKVGDVRTLEKLSKFNIKIAGEVRQSIAAKTKDYLGNLDNYPEIEKDILELVNKIIAPDPRDKARAKDVIIVELFLHDYR